MTIHDRKVLGPEELATIGSVFEEAWAAVGGSLGGAEAADARARLASIMIGLAQIGSLAPEEIKRTAIRIFLGVPERVETE
ncbi:MAG: hypothetical protein WAW96_02615 [Alphaproteobacteria bacterium]